MLVQKNYILIKIFVQILFKTALKMTSSKLRFKADKMRMLNKMALGAISKDLKSLAGTKGPKFDRGLLLIKIRISKLVNDDNTADIYEILVVDCELMLSKLNRLLSVRHERKSAEIEGGDETVNKLTRKMMFASNYVNVKEFRKLVTLLISKYGKLYYEEAIKTFGLEEMSKAEEDFRKKCTEDSVDELTEMYLKEFCDTYKIDLYGEGLYKDENNEESKGDDHPDGGSDSDDDGNGGNTEKKEERAGNKGDNMDDLKKRFEALKRI